jgi:4-amino-4-deoxy-L-arabinose transferase-like glycosyltransferase
VRPPREDAASPVDAPLPPAKEAAASPPAPVAAAPPRVSATAEAGRLLGQQAPLLAILALAGFLRFWQLGAVGFNSDEAVYTGSAAALTGNTTLAPMFPVFRAHPLLFQSMLSLALRLHDTDWTARAFAAVIGIATVAATFALARSLYGRTAGLYAALLLAVMPYHVVVSRQVLLDGLMTLCATVALCCVVRYVESGRMIWLSAGGGMMGAAIITKETSVILLGGLYAFFALTPGRLRIRHLLVASLVMVTLVASWPLMLRIAGHSQTSQSYLLWQLFRRPNHGTWFYFTTLPPWIGPAVLLVVLAGLVWLRDEGTWRERLLLAWIAVPVIFFTLWPVKGFQYLLPIGPALAALAGRVFARPLARPSWLTWPSWARISRPSWAQISGRAGGSARLATLLRSFGPQRAAMGLLAAVTFISLAVPAWARIEPSASATFLAGSGGLNGGRAAGLWILRSVPHGARLLAIGPSAANVLEFYGHQPVAALSVSSDPRNRNPAYTPVRNPDLAMRRGDFQYVVWDAYTAARTPYFAGQARRLANKYHGVAVYTSTVTVQAPGGARLPGPAFVIYQVRP